MKAKHLSFACITLLLAPLGTAPPARADGDCTARPLTPAEGQAFTRAYELFQRVAPAVPDGWTATDHPRTAALPTRCQGDSAPMHLGFQREFSRDSDLEARNARAMQAYADLTRRQQAQAAANKAQIDTVDAQIQALTAKAQAAAAAQRFAEIEGINQQIDALMKRRMTLSGFDQAETESARIEAELERDTQASFRLWFEVPRNEPRTGQPYRTSAGQALLSAYESKGNPKHDVHVYFAGAPRQANVQVTGAPERVRALLDAADLKAIAAFK